MTAKVTKAAQATKAGASSKSVKPVKKEAAKPAVVGKAAKLSPPVKAAP